MKKELYTHFVYLNSVFKTTELKISSSNILEISEISVIGSQQQSIDLKNTDLDIKHIKTKKYLNNLFPFLLFSFLVTAVLQFLYIHNTEILFQILRATSVLITTVILVLHFKNQEKYFLFTPSSSKVIYQFNVNSNPSKYDEIKEFIDELTARISKNNYPEVIQDIELVEVDDDIINSKKEEHYNNLIYHVESLYNSGVVDDNTFDRIEANINEKIYPELFDVEKKSAEIIYLHNI